MATAKWGGRGGLGTKVVHCETHPNPPLEKILECDNTQPQDSVARAPGNTNTFVKENIHTKLLFLCLLSAGAACPLSLWHVSNRLLA